MTTRRSLPLQFGWPLSDFWGQDEFMFQRERITGCSFEFTAATMGSPTLKSFT